MLKWLSFQNREQLMMSISEPCKHELLKLNESKIWVANGTLRYIYGAEYTEWKHHSRWVNTLRPRQNGRYFADDTFKRVFINKNVRISINISLKFVPKGLINNIPALVQIMAWRRPGDKPLSEPMLVSLSTHICVTRPQWVKPTK